MNLPKAELTLKSVIFYSAMLAVVLNLCDAAYSMGRNGTNLFAQPDDTKLADTTPGYGPIPETTKPSDHIVVDAEAKLTAAGLKPDYADLYLAVQSATGTPWEILAAVHQIETGQRGNTSITSNAGAVGPMQFMPATFAHYHADGDTDGAYTITDLDDAMLSAGRYLAANGAAAGKYDQALFRYNHSDSYVAKVKNLARRLGL